MSAAHWLGPYNNADDALNELRKSAAEIIGEDPETWPDHGNAPLAIAVTLALARRTNPAPAPAQEPVAVPAGWKLVPIEATYEMIVEGRIRTAQWDRAIAAAPPAPVSPPAESGEVERLRGGWMLMNDNGKKWRICGPAGRWVMKPEGAITADEARTICETAMGTALAEHDGGDNER